MVFYGPKSMNPSGSSGTSGLPMDAAISTQMTNPQQGHSMNFGQPAMINTPYTPTTFRNTGPHAGK